MNKEVINETTVDSAGTDGLIQIIQWTRILSEKTRGLLWYKVISFPCNPEIQIRMQFHEKKKKKLFRKQDIYIRYCTNYTFQTTIFTLCLLKSLKGLPTKHHHRIIATFFFWFTKKAVLDEVYVNTFRYNHTGGLNPGV